MDKYFNGEYRTKSPRLSNWDYGSNGNYFVTISTKNKNKYLGSYDSNELVLNQLGNYAKDCWISIPQHYTFVILDTYIIMPNHIHGIIKIAKKDYKSWNPGTFGPQSQNLGAIIRGFKAAVTKFARENTIEFAWQSRYYDRIIRNDQELKDIREYILDNPRRWLMNNGDKK